MRFYLDEDLSNRIAEIARSRGMDILSSHECGRDGSSDEEQLWLAAQEGRCLVTRNRSDFIKLTVQFFERNWPHCGVLIISPSLPGDDFRGTVEALIRYAAEHPEGLPNYTIDFCASGE